MQSLLSNLSWHKIHFDTNEQVKLLNVVSIIYKSLDLEVPKLDFFYVLIACTISSILKIIEHKVNTIPQYP